MPGQDIVFTGTTGPGGTAPGDSEPDRGQWLGKLRAAETLHSLASTLTAAQVASARHEVIDSARIGDGEDAHELKWMTIHTGSAALAAARVMSFDNATGAYKLDRNVGPGLAGIGDAYKLYATANVFENVTAAQAAAGAVQFRSITAHNTTGVALTNARVYFRPLGSLDATALARIHQRSSGGFIEREDDATDILDGLGQRVVGGGSDGFAGSGGWVFPFGYAVADTLIASLANTLDIGIWLRRTVSPGAQFRRSVAIQIILESDVGGDDPDPLTGPAVIAYDVLGGMPGAVVQPDRFTHVRGGARILGTVTEATGSPIAQRAVRYAVRAGDAGQVHTDANPVSGWTTTDGAGRVAATYISPIDGAFAGQLTHPQIIVGAGEEVGDP